MGNKIYLLALQPPFFDHFETFWSPRPCGECRLSHEEVIMEFSEIYKRCFEINPSLKDKIENEGKDFCVINFHEYLTIGFDDDYIDINHGFTHAHLDGADNKLFFDIIQGNMVFVQDTRKFSIKMFSLLQPWNLKIMNKQKFETKKASLMKKKYLRIYTVNEIIKRSEK